LRKQLDEWRQPLAEDPAVEEAIFRMLQSLDHHIQHRQAGQEARA
jgi:hypothetical protein